MSKQEETKARTKCRTVGKRIFKCHFMWLIGFGFGTDNFQYDEYSVFQTQTLYLPFLRINATQYIKILE